MTPQQQAEAIVEKYFLITGYKESAIMCAITEVEACIETANDSIAFKQSKRDRLNDILSHLKQM
jgi:hypothetical protein